MHRQLTHCMDTHREYCWFNVFQLPNSRPNYLPDYRVYYDPFMAAAAAAAASSDSNMRLQVRRILRFMTQTYAKNINYNSLGRSCNSCSLENSSGSIATSLLDSIFGCKSFKCSWIGSSSSSTAADNSSQLCSSYERVITKEFIIDLRFWWFYSSPDTDESIQILTWDTALGQFPDTE